MLALISAQGANPFVCEVEASPPLEWECTANHKKCLPVCDRCGLCKKFCCASAGRHRPKASMVRARPSIVPSSNVDGTSADSRVPLEVVPDVGPLCSSACRTALCTVPEHAAASLCVRHCGCDVNVVPRLQPAAGQDGCTGCVCDR